LLPPSLRLRRISRCARNDVEVAPHTLLSSPRRRGSSTPRPIVFITAVSGILDHPPARVTTTEYVVAISPHHLCEFLPATSRPPIRGRREDRVLAAPAVPCAICANKTAHEHTGQREHSGLPCAMALRLTSCSSRRTALLPPLSQRSFASPERDAGTATSEPHDFAVRVKRARLSRPPRPSHPTARS
jgi:hypothetical protein